MCTLGAGAVFHGRPVIIAPMRIVVDAMGSDFYPTPDVEGAVLAARETGVSIVLVGDEKRIRPILAAQDTAGLSIDAWIKAISPLTETTVRT